MSKVVKALAARGTPVGSAGGDAALADVGTDHCILNVRIWATEGGGFLASAGG